MPASGNAGTGVIGVPTDLSDQSLLPLAGSLFAVDDSAPVPGPRARHPHAAGCGQAAALKPCRARGVARAERCPEALAGCSQAAAMLFVFVPLGTVPGRARGSLFLDSGSGAAAPRRWTSPAGSVGLCFGYCRAAPRGPRSCPFVSGYLSCFSCSFPSSPLSPVIASPTLASRGASLSGTAGFRSSTCFAVDAHCHRDDAVGLYLVQPTRRWRLVDPDCGQPVFVCPACWPAIRCVLPRGLAVTVRQVAPRLVSLSRRTLDP